MGVRRLVFPARGGDCDGKRQTRLQQCCHSFVLYFCLFSYRRQCNAWTQKLGRCFFQLVFLSSLSPKITGGSHHRETAPGSDCRSKVHSSSIDSFIYSYTDFVSQCFLVFRCLSKCLNDHFRWIRYYCLPPSLQPVVRMETRNL